MKTKVISTTALIGAAYLTIISLLFILLPKVMTSFIYTSIPIEVVFVLVSAISFISLAVFFAFFPSFKTYGWSRLSSWILAVCLSFTAFFLIIQSIKIGMGLEGFSVIYSRLMFFMPLLIAALLYYFFTQYVKTEETLSTVEIRILQYARIVMAVPIVLSILLFIHKISTSPFSDWIYNNRVFINQFSGFLAYSVLVVFLLIFIRRYDK